MRVCEGPSVICVKLTRYVRGCGCVNYCSQPTVYDPMDIPAAGFNITFMVSVSFELGWGLDVGNRRLTVRPVDLVVLVCASYCVLVGRACAHLVWFHVGWTVALSGVHGYRIPSYCRDH